MRKGFLIYEEMCKYFPIYEEAVSHVLLCNCSILNFLIYEENLIFFFLSVLLLLRVQETWGDLAGDLLAAGEVAGDQEQHAVTWHPLTYFKEVNY
jgi:hypothetical protein